MSWNSCSAGPDLIGHWAPDEADGPLRWFQWDGVAWQGAELDPLLKHGHSLSLGDVDHNGLLDFLVAEMHTPGAGAASGARAFLNQGHGVFAAESVNVGLGNHESWLADVNGDGWLDVVGKPFSAGDRIEIVKVVLVK